MNNGFHIRIHLLPNGLFRHDFYYNTDLRFFKDLPCVDASAIDAWCNDTEQYKRVHISW